MWSFQIHETLSGDLVERVEPSSGSWRRAFTEPGSGSHVFELRGDRDNVPVGQWRSMWRSMTQPWARTLVVLWSGTPVYAGLISGRKYDRKTGRLSCSHVEVRHILRRRFMFPFGEFNPGTQLHLASKGFRGLIRAVAMAGLYRPASPFWNLPVDFPADQSGSYTMTWWHYQGKTVEEMLAEIDRMTGAPHWDFVPKLVAGKLRWELVVGSPRLPGPLVELHDVEESPASELTVTEDGIDQITGALAFGQGAEADVLWAIHGQDEPLTGTPWMDIALSEKTVSDQAQLARLAKGSMDERELIRPQYGVSITADDAVTPALIRPGTTIRVYTYGDEFIADGAKDLYTIAVSGDMSYTVKPEVVEV